MTRSVHVLVPEGIDDPGRPSGGNRYDRRVCSGLAGLGWAVHEHEVPGPWPRADAGAHEALRATLAALPDRALVLADGLVASAAPAVLVPHAARLALVVLVHMPLEDAGEAAVLGAATAVIATSHWTRARLLDRYNLPPDLVHVAVPGTDRAEPTAGSEPGGRLLCVGAVTRLKGHDVLVDALGKLAEWRWECTCAGPLGREPQFAADVAAQAAAAGLAGRVHWIGPRTGTDLAGYYARADLLVLPSRAETYGMVITEALARGLPVIASAVGGVPEALGPPGSGRAPGLLVAPDDPAALAGALEQWLSSPQLRAELRRAAAERRTGLPDWPATTERIARVLAAASPVNAPAR